MRLLVEVGLNEERDRTVIGAGHLIVDYVVDQELLRSLGKNEIVQAPADVSFARRSSSRPERVGAGGVRVEVSVTIEETAIQQIGEVWKMIGLMVG